MLNTLNNIKIILKVNRNYTLKTKTKHQTKTNQQQQKYTTK